MTVVSKQGDRFTETEIDDEIVVMHLGTGEFFSLSGTAAATWRLIDGTRGRAELVTELSSQFDGKAFDIGRDVDGFLGQLQTMGLIDLG